MESTAALGLWIPIAALDFSRARPNKRGSNFATVPVVSPETMRHSTGPCGLEHEHRPRIHGDFLRRSFLCPSRCLLHWHRRFLSHSADHRALKPVAASTASDTVPAMNDGAGTARDFKARTSSFMAGPDIKAPSPPQGKRNRQPGEFSEQLLLLQPEGRPKLITREPVGLVPGGARRGLGAASCPLPVLENRRALDERFETRLAFTTRAWRWDRLR